MPGIGIGELVVIFLLLLLFVGPTKLPQVARTLGRAMGEVRRATDELKSALYLEEVRQRRSSTPPPPRREDGDHSTHGPRVREVEHTDEPPVPASAASDTPAVAEPTPAETAPAGDEDTPSAEDPER